MKNFLFTLALSAATILTASGQEALGTSAPVVSPVINPDNTVTLSVKAGAGHDITIKGTCVKDGTAAMTLAADSASWSYTTPELAPGLYYYTFVMDGVNLLDPNNIHILRDVATLNNYFIIKGDGNDIGTLCSVNDVPHGTLSYTWYRSDSLDTSRRMSIYTPAGYDSDPSRRYPVLYLLHGTGGDEGAWIEIGRAVQILDNLIARGEAQPMIVVIPNGNIAEDAAPGQSPEGLIQPTFILPRWMDGGFESMFPEIVNHVDTHYRTIADRTGRAVAGLSMGGFHAMNISREFPEMFDYVGLFSAAMLNRANGDSPVFQNVDKKLARQMKLHPRLYWIAIGRDDFLYQDNVKYRQELDAAGYSYIYHESDGEHKWTNWRDYLALFLPQLFK